MRITKEVYIYCATFVSRETLDFVDPLDAKSWRLAWPKEQSCDEDFMMRKCTMS